MAQFKILFSDYFDLKVDVLSDYGALNICLASDLPLFVDPFLMFASYKPEYQVLHAKVVSHLVFLKDIVTENKGLDVNLNLFRFPEIKQNWLGLSKYGNGGKGLGAKFARGAIQSFNGFYNNFGEEDVSAETHIEKLTLLNSGVGKDFISDFTTNLIFEYLLEYTQDFAINNLAKNQIAEFSLRCVFDKGTKTWQPKIFKLPYFYREQNGDFILLTPLDILTKDEAIINNSDFYSNFNNITNSLSNANLRSSVNEFFRSCLPKKPKKKDKKEAFIKTIKKYPELVDYYIKLKEDNKLEYSAVSIDATEKMLTVLIETLTSLGNLLLDKSDFYKEGFNSYEESLKRAHYLKDVIENNDGYKIFYHDGKAIASENSVQRIFRLTWFESPYDVNSEVNNGRGPADYKVSFGGSDSTIIEFKLAKSSSLKNNLINQTDVYKAASKSANDISVVLCYTKGEIAKVNRVLKQIDKVGHENIVVIDATPKISASKVKYS